MPRKLENKKIKLTRKTWFIAYHAETNELHSIQETKGTVLWGGHFFKGDGGTRGECIAEIANLGLKVEDYNKKNPEDKV